MTYFCFILALLPIQYSTLWNIFQAYRIISIITMYARRSIIIALAVPFALIGTVAEADEANIIISEIAIKSSDSADDFVELYNASDDKKDISGYRLRTRNGKGTEASLRELPSRSIIPSHGFFLWANNGSAYADMADTTSGSSLSEKYSFALLLPKKYGDVPIDAVHWGNPSPFEGAIALPESHPNDGSFVRDLETRIWSVTDVATPTNSRGEHYIKRPRCSIRATGNAVYISEFLPNPAKGDVEFIELYNPGDHAVSIDGWILKDKGSRIELKGDIGSEAYLVPEKSEALSLNDTGSNTITLKEKTGTIVDEACYDRTRDGISINRSSDGWRNGIPTPGKENILNNTPSTHDDVPKKGYRGMPIAMSVRGKDHDGDTLKYSWDFGDGHKSYKRSTTHIYENKGSYEITLTVSDGKDDTIEKFHLEIKTYEAPNIRITSFMPNPKGNDTDAEWIMIENHEKKKAVDLAGWSIATGWKKLINHPIHRSFIVPPKSSAKITHKQAAFTLPNQKSVIELRAPDKKTLQKITYKLPQPIPDDALFTKKKGERWRLVSTMQDIPTEKQPLATSSSIKQSIGAIQIIPQNPPLSEPEDASSVTSLRSQDSLQTDNRQKLSEILNYGSNLHIPEEISYIPQDQIPIAPATITSKMIGHSKNDFFEQANALISDWMNTFFSR
jgi:PKD repeat protein